jgi:5'-3' exonuclease
MTKALIDADILCYSVGFSTEDEDSLEAILKMDSRIDEITFNCGASEYVLYLSGSNNFRKKLFPSYKAHRKQPKPKHFQALRDYLIDVEKAVVAEGQEADDLLGINQDKAGEFDLRLDDGVAESSYDTIICTIDKDLLQVPGWHYNWNKDEVIEVSVAEGLKNFYRQLLTGDATDNIPGQVGIGPKKANDILAGCETEEQYNKVVFDSYKKYFEYCTEDEVFNHINIIGKLLYIRRKEGEVWSFDLDARQD